MTERHRGRPRPTRATHATSVAARAARARSPSSRVGLILLAQRLGSALARGFTIPLVVLGLGVAVLWRVADDTQRERWRAAAAATGSGRRAPGCASSPASCWCSLGVGAMLAVNGGFSARARTGCPRSSSSRSASARSPGRGWSACSRGAATSGASGSGRRSAPSSPRTCTTPCSRPSRWSSATPTTRARSSGWPAPRSARCAAGSTTRSAPTAGTFSPSLERIAAEVEERHGGTVEVVVVGDATGRRRGSAATLQAAREAMVNAAKYASERRTGVGLRRGRRRARCRCSCATAAPGFDVAAGPRRPPRRARVDRRADGTPRRTRDASAATSEGTEVELEMPRETS